jgi:hypothetical protein
MATWPSTLPQSLLADGYIESSESGVIRTSMDAGPEFVRPRFSAVRKFFSGSMILTPSQLSTLITFFDVTLKLGSGTFEWHPQGFHALSPSTVYDMRFMAPPSIRSIAGNLLYQVDMSFEALP